MNAPALVSDIYGRLDPEAAGAARDAAMRIKLRMERTVQDIIEIGRSLTAVKKVVGHGNFGEWIEAEFGFSASTAQNMMNVAEQFGGKIPNVGKMAASVLYALAAPSAEPIREEAVAMAARGEKVSLKTVDDLKAKLEKAESRAKSAKQDVEVHKEQAERIRADRERLLNDVAFLRSQVADQGHEIARLKEDGVIHVVPTVAAPAPAREAPLAPPPARAALILTIAEALVEGFSGDWDEIIAMMREADYHGLADALEMHR